MRGDELIKELKEGRRKLGVPSKKCRKFTGALAIEILRRALEKEGIQTSRPNVYLKGLGNEVDLIIPRKGATAQYDILYNPADVLAVLEIKTSGLFSEKDARDIKAMFEQVQSINPNIFCAYVTMSERKSYKNKATEKTLGFPVYTLTWHNGPKQDSEADNVFSALVRKLASLGE